MDQFASRIRRNSNIFRITLIVLFFSFSLAGIGQGQDGPIVHLVRGRMSYVAIFDSITRQYGIGVERSHVKLDTGLYLYINNAYLPLNVLLKRCLDPMEMTYLFKEGTIWIMMKETEPADVGGPVLVITVMVTGYQGERLAGAFIHPAHSQKYYETAQDGTVTFVSRKKAVLLLVSHVGYKKEQRLVNRGGQVEIHLQPLDDLNIAIFKGYGTGTRGIYTGNRSYMDSMASREHPATSLLAYLAGRVPGLLSMRTSGVSGSSYKVSLRGKMSVLNGGDLFYIIDGIPFGPQNQSLSNSPAGNSGGSLDPFSLLPMDDIENVEVLKDADATAIYGSRGANGVVLITTRRGMAGRPKWDVAFNSGESWVSRRPALLNIHQYTAMRLEALRNDAQSLDMSSAPELLKWDTTHGVDWGKQFIGGHGQMTDGHVSFSGAGKKMSYFTGMSLQREISVFDTHPAHSLVSLDGRFSHRAANRRFSVDLAGLMAWDRNRQFSVDLTRLQFLTPNAPPSLRGKDGQPIFNAADVAYTNPLFFIGNRYEARSHNLLVSGAVGFRLFDTLLLRINGGVSDVGTNDGSISPIWNQDPADKPMGSRYLAGTCYRSWIIEPQLEYTFMRRRWTLNMLAGTSRQGLRSRMDALSAFGFTADPLLGDVKNATDTFWQHNLADYMYKAWFARINLNWKNTYVLNLTGRRDGSSHFEGSKQYGNFGAAGFAWIFSEEGFSRKALPFLSFGKLRASYGVTGNDQIGGGNRYLESWSPTSSLSFSNVPGVSPAGPVNPDISWERVRKMEVSMDLGFFQNRWFFTASWYRHRSGHQLLPDSLPLTGDLLHLQNQPVVLENRGWEISLVSRNIDGRDFSWTTKLNINFPVNRLVTFGGFHGRPFTDELVEGQSLRTLKAYWYIGVSPLTGTYQVEDRNGDGKYTDADRTVAGNLDVTCFGGMENLFRWKRWRLEALMEGRVQTGARYEAAIFAASTPGSIASGLYSNQLADIVNRWRKPGDKALYQKVSGDTDTKNAKNRYLASSGILTDASFIRMRTLTLSYQWPALTLLKMRLQGLILTLQGQNLLTWTPYKWGDPEIQNAVILPPLKTITAGLRVKF